eukprot:Hpha_TRINITY_DN19439_c0_g1::TRINITY_DN19439_c0_g1_i1::g.45818::m.45818/K00476/ASPH; aspartate beta-hydroxylase
MAAGAAALRAAGLAAGEVARASMWLRSVGATEPEQLAVARHFTSALGGSMPYARTAPWLKASLGLGPRPEPASEGQRGCHDTLPGLRAQPWWTPEDAGLDSNRAADAARGAFQELLASRNDSAAHFLPYRNPSSDPSVKASAATSQGQWNVLYLDLHGADTPGAQVLPTTADALRRPLASGGVLSRPFGHALLSALAPSSHIVPHHGPTNKKLRLYIPLNAPGGAEDECYLEVGGKRRELEAMKPLVFDDSFLHHAVNGSKVSSRLVLIADLWHPDLSDDEVDLLALMQNLHERTLQRHAVEIEEEFGDDDDDDDDISDFNFYSVLRRSSKAPPPPDSQSFSGFT